MGHGSGVRELGVGWVVEADRDQAGVANQPSETTAIVVSFVAVEELLHQFVALGSVEPNLPVSCLHGVPW